jgi:transcriptional regulator with XRE-family HTH domain
LCGCTGSRTDDRRRLPRCRRRREQAELTQEALADGAHLHRTYISLLERGWRMPSILVVKQLAEALGTTMASLMAELEGSGE